MSSGSTQIQRIEEKLVKLLSQHQRLLRENEKLRNEQAHHLENEKKLKSRVEELELRIALIKSNEPVATKTARAALEKKINAYVKEIDKCIAVLGNQS